MRGSTKASTGEILWLSKTRYVCGRQCARQLWWRVHEPDAPELVPDATLAERFATGHQVGELARQYVPGGVVIGPERGAFDERVQATRRAVDEGARVVYEAAFFEDQVFVAADILERSADGSWTLIEVKSTTRVAEQHIADAAVQTHVLRRAGLDVRRTEIMHLNRSCAAPNLANLFARVDVTTRVERELLAIPGDLERLHATLAGPLPAVAPGDQCRRPYDCPFVARCGAVASPDHVRSLYRIGARAVELEQRGYARIADVPDDVELPAVADRQRRAVAQGRLVVEPTLGAAMRALVPPIGFLDFETVALAVPRWNGCHPYDAVPVQFSVHVVRRDDAPAEHFAFLAEPGSDPRPALAAALVEALQGVAVVVAYNAPFERKRIEELATAVPTLSRELLNINGRVVDLLPIVRNHVAHPDFGGGFGLKAVAPVLAPGSYADVAIHDGGAASVALKKLLLGELAPEETERVKGELLGYCEEDTRATMGVWRALRALVGSA